MMRRMCRTYFVPMALSFLIAMAGDGLSDGVFVNSGQELVSARGNFSRGLALGDFDGDGDIDAVAAQGDSGTAMANILWRNDGAGLFIEYPANLGEGDSVAAAAADFDKDGDLDLWIANDGNASPEADDLVWINQGGAQGGTNGVFALGAAIPNGRTTAVALGDVNGDGLVDAVTLGNFVDAWLNQGSGAFASTNTGLFPIFSDILLVDLNADGAPDILGVGEITGIYWNDWSNSQTFVEGPRLDRAALNWASPKAVAVGLLDADAHPDVYVATAGNNGVWWNNGDGSFTVGSLMGSVDDSHVALADLDLDGDLDAFVTRRMVSHLGNGYWLNNGNRTFSDGGQELGSAASFRVGLADLNGDTTPDAFVANSGPNTVWANVTTPVPPISVPQYIITTVAGNGTAGWSGDDGPATAAQIRPSGLAFDDAGRLLIADGFNNRVRVVDTNGVISTLAGAGTAGYSGDGGPAALAEFNSVRGVAADAIGRVYIADYFNYRVRRVDTNGIVTTVAGTGTPGFSGDGGAATNAAISAPGSIHCDASGNLYIADNINYRVRRVDTNGIITTVAGIGEDGYDGDGGPATLARIGLAVSGLTTGKDGSLYFCQAWYNVVRGVSPGGTISTIAGTGEYGYAGNGAPATQAVLSGPSGCAVDHDGALLIADRVNRRIRRVDASGRIATVAGTGALGFSGDGGPALDAALRQPWAIATDNKGNVFFEDHFRVRRLTPSGGTTTTFSPRFTSFPHRNTTVNFGNVNVGDGTGKIIGVTRSIHIGNDGNADLLIHSVTLSGVSNVFEFVGLPSLPASIGDGHASSLFTVAIVGKPLDDPQLVIYEGVVTVATSDPLVPIARYTLLAEGNRHASQSWEQTHARLTQNSAEAQSVAAAGERPSAELSVAALPLTRTFKPDTNAACSVVSEVPDFLGGGVVTISNFSGTVTVTAHPIPNDYERAALTIDGGEFRGPSVVVGPGLATGPNTLVFGAAELSEGLLDLTNGHFTAKSVSILRNDLFPDGIYISNSYTGIFDFAASTLSFVSDTTDYYEATDRIQLIQQADQSWLLWVPGVLEETLDLIHDEWRPISNAVSPYLVDTLVNTQQFFRVRSP